MTEDFKKTLSEAFGEGIALRTLAALEEPASVSVRLNPFKPADTGHLLSEAEPVAWNRYGYMLGGRPSFTLDPLFHAGAYYVQDSSAMAVGAVARQFITRKNRPLRVLDLCAAPGGKTTDLAASLREVCGSGFLLVANEVMKGRAGILAENTARWGDPCVTVTNCDPKAFARLGSFFDIIVADVPCSGEGMFRKDAEAVEQWSMDNVALCEARQRRIIADIWPALAKDGILVYSTCTFNTRENDGNVEWAAATLGAEICTPAMDFGWLGTRHGYSLVPGLVRGEGQYCAALRKTGGDTAAGVRGAKRGKGSSLNGLFSCGMETDRRGDLIVAFPPEIAGELSAVECLHPIMTGVAAGTMKGRDFIPHADLAMNIFLAVDAFPQIETDREEALKFLHKDPLTLPQAPKGILLIKHGGCGLGFVKNLGNRTNSLLPQERRIRMEINHQ